MLVFTFVLISYFLVTAGIAYDMIQEPPAVGAAPDPVTGAWDFGLGFGEALPPLPHGGLHGERVAQHHPLRARFTASSGLRGVGHMPI